MKKCSSCGTEVQRSHFYKNRSAYDGLSTYCKKCTDIQNKKDKIKRYGLTTEQFEYLLEQQDHRCAICQKIFTDKMIPVIDHDHSCCPKSASKTGQTLSGCGKCVRGLLCTSCNAGLGMFNDDIQRLISAINYLKNANPVIIELDELSLEFLEEGIAYARVRLEKNCKWNRY